jgi:hypothetical protein
MAKYVVALVVFALFGAFALLSAIYCAWLTATPLAPQALHKAQFDFSFWLVTFAITLALSIGATIRMIRLHRTDRGLHGTSTV